MERQFVVVDGSNNELINLGVYNGFWSSPSRPHRVIDRFETYTYSNLFLTVGASQTNMMRTICVRAIAHQFADSPKIS